MLKTSTSRPHMMAFSFMLVLILLLSACGAPAPSTSHTSTVVKGGTWIDDIPQDPGSLIPNANATTGASLMDQALYAPLFYGDSQGRIHPGLVQEMPTVANGEISADSKTWTFKLRPGLLWSDDQPLTAEDVDFTWKLWTTSKFPVASSVGVNLISGAEVSADKLAITFHLTRPFSPFLSVWTDGFYGPVPKHHFTGVAPDKITSTPDNLNPSIVSGPFLMSESKPGDYYTVVRNPKYYRASEGLPYLDQIIFRFVPNLDTTLKDLQASAITSAWFLDVTKRSVYEHLTNYHLAYSPNPASYEAMYFNFHNPILGKDVLVRRAMAMAVDHQALITVARRGLASPLCTDHSQAYQPGYQPDAPCPRFDPAAATALLEQDGWLKGPDGVRTKAGQRLAFTYTTTSGVLWRLADEEIVQANLQAIGIKLTIQNYPADTFFGTILPAGKPGQYDIAEFEDLWTYDPDDASSLACDQFPPNGVNNSFYCNPALDKLYAQEEATTDAVARQRVFDQIHHIYLTDFPFITFYVDPQLAIAKKTTHNYLPSPFGLETVNLWQWWCDGGHC